MLYRDADGRIKSKGISKDIDDFCAYDGSEEYEEEYEEIDYVQEHKTFPVKLKIVKQEKHKPLIDLEEDYDDINDRADYEYEKMMDERAERLCKDR